MKVHRSTFLKLLKEAEDMLITRIDGDGREVLIQSEERKVEFKDHVTSRRTEVTTYENDLYHVNVCTGLSYQVQL